MRNKSIFTACMALLLSLATAAQTKKQPQTLTLTNGRYSESFDEDSIQRIGSALININTMQIVKLQLTKEEETLFDNTHAGRFLSVDPIAKDFAFLTPYQYASNRPIDGIDMDGLEYLTYTIVINKTTAKITSATYNWYNKAQHNAHGNLGQGVLYDIRLYDEKSKSWTFNSVFKARDDWFNSGVFNYGNYMGAIPLYEAGDNGEFTKNYDYSLPAVDAVDNLAKAHDQGYDRLGAKGAFSLFNDWGTTPYDEAALNGWNDLQENYKTGDADPFNNNIMNKDEFKAAANASSLFSIVVTDKKIAINAFITKYYSKEATFGDNSLEKNYQLFLNKYMYKDEDGNWKRNEDMWNKDKKGNFTTPKAPTN